MKRAKYFSAPWCGPCKAFKPIMTEVLEEGHSVEFINIDTSMEAARLHKVTSIPTVIIEEDGVELNRIIGRTSKDEILKQLK